MGKTYPLMGPVEMPISIVPVIYPIQERLPQVPCLYEYDKTNRTLAFFFHFYLCPLTTTSRQFPWKTQTLFLIRSGTQPCMYPHRYYHRVFFEQGKVSSFFRPSKSRICQEPGESLYITSHFLVTHRFTPRKYRHLMHWVELGTPVLLGRKKKCLRDT